MVALLYPFSWQHTFIPVLPASMIDIVCCPTPFLVGLLSSSLPKLKELPVEEVGHCLGDQLGERWRKEGTEGTETPRREGGRGRGGKEGTKTTGIFSLVVPGPLYPAPVPFPWALYPWLELFLLSDSGNPGGLEA